MDDGLEHVPVRRCTGNEPLHAAGRPTGTTQLDFWRWAASDLLGNTFRTAAGYGCRAHLLTQ